MDRKRKGLGRFAVAVRADLPRPFGSNERATPFERREAAAPFFANETHQLGAAQNTCGRADRKQLLSRTRETACPVWT